MMPGFGFFVRASFVASLSACSSTPDTTGGPGHESSTASTAVVGTSSTGVMGLTSLEDSADSTSIGPTSTAPTSGAETSSTDSSGQTFILQHDGGGPCTLECDPYIPDSCCNPQEKCSAWAAGGGGSWNAVKCVTVDADPDQPGEPCTAVGSGASGIDSCEQGAMCWSVDAKTLVGVCVALCTGSPDDPVCPEGTACGIFNDGVLNLCLPDCDPLIQDCPVDELCIPPRDPPAEHFVCVDDASGDMGKAFDPCEFVNVCDKGLACLDSDNSAMCDGRVLGCCLPFCDLAFPVCPGDTTCVPWYAMGMRPLGLEDVGVCSKPS